MPFGHKAGLPPSKKYLLMRQPLFFSHVRALPGSNGSNVYVPLRSSQQFQMLVKHKIAWYDKICSEMLVDGINPILLMTRRKVGSLLTS